MKIAFFTMALIMGGAERVISILCNMVFETDDVSIVTVVDKQTDVSLGDRVKYYGMIPYHEYNAKRRIEVLPEINKQYLEIMRKINPDIIISFLPEPCFIAGFNRKVLKTPVIGSERANPYFQYKNFFYRFLAEWLYTKADGFVFQTDTARSFFNKKLQANSVVIGNPVVTDPGITYTPMNCRKKEIVSVGRFTAEKNYPLLIKAFSKVNEKYPEYVLRIFGRIDEGLGIREVTEKLHISNKVFFEGQVDDVHSKIKGAYVFVLSSLSEGMPNALMEAMSIGLPVIATDCPSGGPRQLIENRVNGILVKNNDVSELAASIIELIEKPDLAEKISSRAIEISERYSAKTICEMWKAYIYKIYQESMEKKKGSKG